MPDPSNPEMTEEQAELLNKQLEEADRIAAEVEAEVAMEMTIGGASSSSPSPSTPSIDEITPEMLENMDPAQLQAIIRQMQGAQKERPSQSSFTKKKLSKDKRKQKRKMQSNARKITMKNGGGKTTTIRSRGASRGG